MVQKRSQDIEIKVPIEDDVIPPRIKWWGFSNEEGSYNIKFTDPLNAKVVRLSYESFLNYIRRKERNGREWENLMMEISSFKKYADEQWKIKGEEKHKPIYKSKNIYKHYYDPKSEKKGVIINEHLLKIDRITEEIIEDMIGEDIYHFSEDVKDDEYWIYDDVLDDLLDRGIEKIRILNNSDVRVLTESFKPMDFIDHGRMDKKKVYISLKDIHRR